MTSDTSTRASFVFILNISFIFGFYERRLDDSFQKSTKEFENIGRNAHAFGRFFKWGSFEVVYVLKEVRKNMGELILRLFSECPPKFFWGSLKRLLKEIRGNIDIRGVLLLEVARRGLRALIKFKS